MAAFGGGNFGFAVQPAAGGAGAGGGAGGGGAPGIAGMGNLSTMQIQKLGILRQDLTELIKQTLGILKLGGATQGDLSGG